MITSEVQRTLVKSPPELWAELSDPTSLARHLGELGEIRITRVDPEQRVEWETTGASGSVAIKPSGWGTKLTRTVQHDGGAGEAPSTPEPASGPSPGEPAGAPEGSDPSPVEATGAPEDSPHASAEVEPRPEPEPEPAPAHIAAPKPVTGLASWAAAFGAERSGSTKPAPKARVESDIAPVATGEHDRDLPEARAEQELPPRGLFAWLFRRRRGHAQTETNLPAAARTQRPRSCLRRTPPRRPASRHPRNHLRSSRSTRRPARRP